MTSSLFAGINSSSFYHHDFLRFLLAMQKKMTTTESSKRCSRWCSFWWRVRLSLSLSLSLSLFVQQKSISEEWDFIQNCLQNCASLNPIFVWDPKHFRAIFFSSGISLVSHIVSLWMCERDENHDDRGDDDSIFSVLVSSLFLFFAF